MDTSESVDSCAAAMNDLWLQEIEVYKIMVLVSQREKHLPFM